MSEEGQFYKKLEAEHLYLNQDLGIKENNLKGSTLMAIQLQDYTVIAEEKNASQMFDFLFRKGYLSPFNSLGQNKIIQRIIALVNQYERIWTTKEYRIQYHAGTMRCYPEGTMELMLLDQNFHPYQLLCYEPNTNMWSNTTICFKRRMLTLKQHLSRKPVLVYTKKGCQQCKILKNYLGMYGIPFVEEKFNADESKLELLREKGYSKFPVLVKEDGKTITGFAIPELENLLKEYGVVK